jgi:Lhr-like helicase
MSSTLTLYDPTAPRALEASNTTEELAATRAAVQKMLTGLSGKVVGFIDNAKPNFSYLCEDLAEILTSKYDVARTVTTQKRAASVSADRAVLDRFGAECDLVICGSGD